MSRIPAKFQSLFECPISYELMGDPVTNTCGHTFERVQINGHIQARERSGASVDCPLCRLPISGLIPNRVVKEAVETLLTVGVDQTEEEEEIVQRAVNLQRERRGRNAAEGLPDRLPVRTSFANKVADAADRCVAYYGCLY